VISAYPKYSYPEAGLEVLSIGEEGKIKYYCLLDELF
jgi:hypothetical protein